MSAVTGSHGLIGSALIPRAARPTAIACCASCGVTRSAPTTCGGIPTPGTIDAAGLEGVDAVVHLAGAGIGDKKWTPAAQAARAREPHAGAPGCSRARSRGSTASRACSCRRRRSGTTATAATRCSPRTSPPGDDFGAHVCRRVGGRDRAGGRRGHPRRAHPHRPRAGRRRAACCSACCCRSSSASAVGSVRASST